MKKLLYLICLCILAIPAHAQLSISLTGDPLVTTGWSYSSEGSVSDSVFQITAPVTNQSSYIYYNTAIDMSRYCSFTADFDFQIIPSGTATVADGLAFWFLTNPPSGSATGSTIGLPSYPDGLILILDTYNNDGLPDNNPLETLVGYSGTTSTYVEGSSTGVLSPVVPSQYFIDDGSWHHCKVTYNEGSVNVYFDYSSTASLSGTYSLTGLSGYFGFSASTGALVSTQNVKQVFITLDACLMPVNNGPLCQGDSLRLAAVGDSTGATYSWTGPGGFTSTLQNPVLPPVTYADSGVYTVIKTVGTGSDTATTDVVVKHTPVVTAGSNSPVCYGADIDLTATPDSTGETFSWTGPGGYTSTLENPVITGATLADTGYYKVNTSLAGCIDSATVHVSVVYIDTLMDSVYTRPFCAGDTIHLRSFDSTAGVTYRWTGPGTFTSTMHDVNIPGATTAISGVYTITARLSGCSVTDTVQVTVNPIPPVPVIAIIPPICSGQNLNLSLIVDTPGATYIWTGPNGFTSTTEDPTITAAITRASGTYSVSEYYNGCPAISPAHVVVRVDSTPAIPVPSSNSPICSGQTIVLSATDATSGVTYRWAGPGGFASTAQDTTITGATLTDYGVYTVTVRSGVCTSQDTETVVINATPGLPVITSDAPVCSGPGNVLTLSANADPSGGTYYWSGPGGYTSTLETINIISPAVSASGSYSVYEVLNGCTSPVASAAVTVDSTPAIPFPASNTPVCQYDTIKLTATDATAGVSYAWTGPLSFTSTQQNVQIDSALPGNTGVYMLTVTLGRCTSSNSIAVSIINAPLVTDSSNSPLCSGDTLKLYASSLATELTYHWDGPYTFSYAGPDPIRPAATTEMAGVYTLTVHFGTCAEHLLDTVVIHPTPAAPWITWLTYCQYYDDPPLQASGDSLRWYASGTGGAFATMPPTPQTDTPGTRFYYVSQTANGCISPIDSIQVMVNPKPEINTALVDTLLCPHDTVTLRSNAIGDTLLTYKWTPNLFISDTDGIATIVQPIVSQVYTVTATNRYGCKDTATTSLTVYPAAVLEIPDSVTLFGSGESYHFIPETNCSTFSWFPPEGLSDAHISDPVAMPGVDTRYIVEGITENGCRVYDSATIRISSATELQLPNAFTPGSGANGVFRVIREGVATLNYFRIYDRWGQQVYEGNNIDSGWDGSYNGTPQPFGVYIYDVQAVTLKGKIVNLRGNVTLIR